MGLLDRQLADSINLVHKGSFTIVDLDMRLGVGMFTISQDGLHIFNSRFAKNSDQGETYPILRVAKYELPDSYIIPTNFSEIPSTLNRVDIGYDLLGPEIKDSEGLDIFSYVDPDIKSLWFYVAGIHEYNGKLILNNSLNYGSNGLRSQTTFVFDSSNLNASQTALDPTTTIEDEFSIIGVGKCCGNMASVDADWVSFFGGEIFTTAPQQSITTNWSKGPSLTAFNTSELVSTADPDDVITIGATPLLYYPDTTQDSNGKVKAFYDENLFTPEVIAAINSTGNFTSQILTDNQALELPNGSIAKNPYWNTTSLVITSFIVPETRTLAVLTRLDGGTREAYYKDAPTQPYEYETSYTSGVTTAIRDVNGVPIPILDENGEKIPVQKGKCYKSEFWRYNPTLGDYEVVGPSDGDGLTIKDDAYLSVFLFDTLQLQEVKDGLKQPWEVRHYKQQLFKQPLDFTSGVNVNASPEAGDYNLLTNELFVSYKEEYRYSTYTYFPIFTVYDVVAQVGESITSIANLHHSDVPDGVQQIKIWSEGDNQLIFNGDLTFLNGGAITPPLSLPSSTPYYARWLGDNPPTTGTGIYGVTQYV